MSTDLNTLATNWDTLGETDPLWAVLTDPAKRGGGWDREEFFEVGEREIERLMAALERHATPASRDVAVDFGCGVGRLSRNLAPHFTRVIGVDIAASMVETARRLNADRPNCEFLCNVAPDLSILPSASADLIYSSITLQHIPPRFTLQYLRDFVRILRAGGVAVFQLPGGNDRSLAGVVRRCVPNRLLDPIRVIRHRTRAVMHMYAVPPAEVERTITDAGGVIAHREPDETSGRGWLSYRYYVKRREDADRAGDDRS